MRIGADEPTIEQKLAEMFRWDPGVNGGVDRIQLDGMAVSLDRPIPNILATGHEVLFVLDRGFCVHVTDGTIRHGWRLTARASEDCLRIRVSAHGQARYLGSEEEARDEGAKCMIIVQPADARLTAAYDRGDYFRACSIDVSRRFLAERLGVALADLPKTIRHAWQRAEVAFGQLPLGRLSAAAADRLLRIRSPAGWRLVEAKAVALDLLQAILSNWSERSASATLIRLSAADQAALNDLRAEADRRCPKTLGIGEAVAASGLNRNKVHYGFKQLFGTTLLQYCLDRRMAAARDMLRETDRPVAEIAFELGFSEPTNFSAAFMKRFATSPSEWRRAALARTPAE